MKHKDYKYLIYTLLATLCISCSLHKRHYLHGYYLENKGKEGVVIKNINDSNNTSHLDSSRVRDVSLNKNSTYKKNCDTLLLNDGTTLICKIEEVSKRTVRFKDCTDSNQVSNSIDVELVSSIKFYNGREKIVSGKITNKPKNNTTLIKSTLIDKGLTLAILAILLEIVLLLALFHVLVLATYLIIALAVLNLLAAIVAISFGFMSLRDIRKNPEVFKGKKMAAWEIGLGLLSLVSWLIILIIITI